MANKDFQNVKLETLLTLCSQMLPMTSTELSNVDSWPSTNLQWKHIPGAAK